MDAITYAQFIAELAQLSQARQHQDTANRVTWLRRLTDWAEQADGEARDGLPGALAE